MSISMSAPMTADRSFHVLDAVPTRLEASPQRPRRRWSAEAKGRLIEASLEPGANVSAIAREAGISPSQLFGWRRKALKGGMVKPREDGKGLGFIEITPTAAAVEIELEGVVIRVGADIGQEQLAKVIRAVRKA